MPRLITANERFLEACSFRKRGIKGGPGTADGVIDGEKEEERSEGAQSPGQMNVFWRCCSGWCCLAPAAAVWLVLQAEAPQHPSVSLAEAGARLLLAGALALVLGLSALVIRFLSRHRHTLRQSLVRLQGSWHRDVQEPEVKDEARRLEAAVCALSAGLLRCVLQEPMPYPSPAQIRVLHAQHLAVSRALQGKDPLPQQDPDGQGTPEEGPALMRDVTRISTYLQNRVALLSSLLGVQNELEVCVCEVQHALQLRWEQLEELHTRVTLSPDCSQAPDDTHDVLADTEELFTELGALKSWIQQCQTSLSTSTELLQELGQTQHALAQSVNMDVESSWTTDLLQTNSKQLDGVREDFASLEQQMSTFVTHLRGLGGTGTEGTDDCNQSRHSRTSTLSSVPVYSASTAPETSATLDPDPQISAADAPATTRSKRDFAMSLLCGVRRRKR